MSGVGFSSSVLGLTTRFQFTTFILNGIMRELIKRQMDLGEVDIGAIEISTKSRDDIPRLLRGLQHNYTTEALREDVFAILAEVVPQRPDDSGAVGVETGRPGMSQWQILVLGVLRLGLNADYDRIAELANQHKTIRQMLGHADWTDESQWHVQTLKDNLRLFTPELLERINRVVVAAGHALVKKSPDDGLAVRSDSFVVETDVHFPTDINLLYDAVRKAIETSAQLCGDLELSDWRQSAHNVRCLKKAYRRAQQLKRSTSKDEAKRAERSDDQHGFILNHRVMQRETDDQAAIPLVEDLAANYPQVESVSMDKGFHSPANQRALAEIIDFPVLPKKGKRSAAEQARERNPRFVRLRRRHSGVESAINALEVHGLDMCPDHGIDGFKRYVALAVVGRNLHRLGAILLAQEAEQERRARRRAA